jgi:hypothetical protein
MDTDERVVLSGGLVVDLRRGAKGPEDTLIIVEGKKITIMDLLELIQRIAANEWRVNEAAIRRHGRFFFREAVMAAVHWVPLGRIRSSLFRLPYERIGAGEFRHDPPDDPARELGWTGVGAGHE